MTEIYTPGGMLGPFTKPNVEPAKGHWALHQAYSSKNHAGSAAQDVFHAARIYIELGKAKLPTPSDPRLKAIVGAVHSKDGATGYVDFHLSGLSFGYQERSQLQVAQNDNFVEYFFGSSPATITLQGVLLNTIQDDWSNNMLEIYWNILRGTKMAQRRSLIRLRLMDRIYSFTLRSFSENFSTSSSTTTGFSLSGTLYSIRLVPSPSQHYLPTDMLGIARSTARREASSRVSSAIKNGQGNALLLSVSGLILGPEVAAVSPGILSMQLGLNGGLPTVAQTVVAPGPQPAPSADTQTSQAASSTNTRARTADVTQGTAAARATVPALRPQSHTTARGAGQTVTSSATQRTAPSSAKAGSQRRDPQGSTSSDFHSLDPGAGGL